MSYYMFHKVNIMDFLCHDYNSHLDILIHHYLGTRLVSPFPLQTWIFLPEDIDERWTTRVA